MQNWSFHVVVLPRTVKKCTKSYNARAQPLFCSLNLLCSDVPVAVAVVVILNSLLIESVPTLLSPCNMYPSEHRPYIKGVFNSVRTSIRVRVVLDLLVTSRLFPVHSFITVFLLHFRICAAITWFHKV